MREAMKKVERGGEEKKFTLLAAIDKRRDGRRRKTVVDTHEFSHGNKVYPQHKKMKKKKNALIFSTSTSLFSLLPYSQDFIRKRTPPLYEMFCTYSL